MARLDHLVRDVVGGNPGIMAAFIFDGDGQVEASSGTSDDMLAAAVAFLVPVRDILERTVAALGCGIFESTLVQGSKATLAITDIDGVRAVAIMGHEGAPVGALLSDSVFIARGLREERAA